MACNKLAAGPCTTHLLVTAMDTPALISRWMLTFQKWPQQADKQGRAGPGPLCAAVQPSSVASPPAATSWQQLVPRAAADKSILLCLGTAPCVISTWETGLLACLFCCVCLRLNLLVWFRGETQMQVTAQRCGKGRRRGGSSSGYD